MTSIWRAYYDRRMLPCSVPCVRSYLEADELERTFKFTQEQLAEHVDESSQRKVHKQPLLPLYLANHVLTDL